MLFSLSLSHDYYGIMYNTEQDDKFLNVTESGGQAEDADVSRALIYENLDKENDKKWNHFQSSPSELKEITAQWPEPVLTGIAC